MDPGAREKPTLVDLRLFVAEYPRCWAMALADSGVDTAPLPSEIAEFATGSRPKAGADDDGSNSLALVSNEDRSTLVAAFARCWRSGYSHCMVTYPGDDEAATVTFWDLRNEVGHIIVVTVPGLEVEVGESESAPLRPRLLMHTVDDTGRTLTCDDATELLLGWTPADIVGKSRLDYLHPDDQERSIVHWVELLGMPGQSHRMRLRFKMKNEDRYKWFEVTQTNRLATHGHVTAEMLDISEEQTAIEMLHDRERLLARLTEALPTAVLHVGSSLEVLFANERLEEITGLVVGDSRSYLELVSPEDQARLIDSFGRAAKGKDSDLEMHVRRVDGASRLCRVQVRTLGDEKSGVLLCIDDITESALLQSQLEHQATTDGLTGVANRVAVLEALAQAQLAACSTGQVNAVVFLDLDGFKQVNDVHGHAVGDQLLVATASSLSEAVRPTDVVGRLGGDEFLVVCADVGSAEMATELADRLQEVAARTLNLGGTFVQSRASCGVAVDVGGSHTPEELVAQADREMYSQKNVRAQIKRYVANLSEQEQTSEIGSV